MIDPEANVKQKRKGKSKMSNFVLFINSFLSYLLLFAVIVIVAGIAMFIGIKMRKKKNEEEAAISDEDKIEEAITQ